MSTEILSAKDILKQLPTREPAFVSELLAAIERSQLNAQRIAAAKLKREQGYVESKLKLPAFVAQKPLSKLRTRELEIADKVPQILNLIEANPTVLKAAEDLELKKRLKKLKRLEQLEKLRSRAIKILQNLNREPRLMPDGTFKLHDVTEFECALRDALKEAQAAGVQLPFTFIGGKDEAMAELIVELKRVRREATAKAKLELAISALSTEEFKELQSQLEALINESAR